MCIRDSMKREREREREREHVCMYTCIGPAGDSTGRLNSCICCRVDCPLCHELHPILVSHLRDEPEDLPSINLWRSVHNVSCTLLALAGMYIMASIRSTHMQIIRCMHDSQ